ncbi:unnamed protein product [Durusdinium trenchii]|uniref:Uncharacterized protein n=1 Tax=Durusdinium trenchii TaxID=1381693 RepID=A0ABP0SI63_9DINO
MAPAANAEDPYLLELLAELNATKKALGNVFGGRLQDSPRSEPISLTSQTSAQVRFGQPEQPTGLLLQTPTLFGKMSHFGRREPDSPSPRPRGRLLSLPGRFRDRADRADATPSFHSTLAETNMDDLNSDASLSSCQDREERSLSPVFQPPVDSERRQVVWRGRADNLGEAVGCLVSGIHLISKSPMRAIHRTKDRDERHEYLEQSQGSGILAHSPCRNTLPWLIESKMRMELEGDQGPRHVTDADEHSLTVARLGNLHSDIAEESSVPTAFVLETPEKYQIGRPPCMFGRSHVNILAHPDWHNFWLDKRHGPARLLLTCQKQFAHLFNDHSTAPGAHSFAEAFCRTEASHPGFMVLTGRWNKRPGAAIEDAEWPFESHHQASQLKDLPDVGFVSTASGPPDLGAPVAPGVGAFFERAGVSHQCLKPHHEEKVEEEPAMFCPKRPEAESKDRYGRCFRCCRRCSRKQFLLILVVAVLCVGLIACLCYLIMVLFRLGPYRCSSPATPLTPEDCSRRLRGEFRTA